MCDIKLEGGACWVEAEGHIWVAAGLIDGYVVGCEVVGRVTVVVAGGVEGLGVEGRGVEDVEFPSASCVSLCLEVKEEEKEEEEE